VRNGYAPSSWFDKLTTSVPDGGLVKPRFFKSQADFRQWLDKHGTSERELWVGYYKKGSGKTGLTYREALDEALCFGWIDGIVKRVDEMSYMQRWTPRTKASAWSLVNIKRVGELTKLGVMAESGLKAFNARDPKRQTNYLYEQQDQPLAPEYERRFKANKRAWTFFEAQPPGYKRLCLRRIMSAKKEETREKRLTETIRLSAAHKRLEMM
jgi:uncharacterized protein YdeI (YjbR/CyaY-like superfamily)